MTDHAVTDLDQDFRERERLFHYTSSVGLFGILQSGCLWGTHYQFLNDSKEFYAAQSSLSPFLESKIRAVFARIKINEGLEYREGVDAKTLSSQYAKSIVDILYGAILGFEERPDSGSDAFVFSTFCCDPQQKEDFENGTLLHWATYGRNGGYALQLDPHKVHRLIGLEGRTFNGSPMLSKRAIYWDGGSPPSELKDKYDAVAQYAQKFAENVIRGGNPADVDSSGVAIPMLEIISVLKDKYFRRESEARIVAFRARRVLPGYRFHDVDIRQTDRLAIPFVRLFQGTLLEEDCPIERIIVGPHPENTRRLNALKVFLRARGLDFIEVFESAVPFIS